MCIRSESSVFRVPLLSRGADGHRRVGTHKLASKVSDESGSMSAVVEENTRQIKLSREAADLREQKREKQHSTP